MVATANRSVIYGDYKIVVFQVTTEMAKHLRQEIFSQKNPNWALSFDVILSATKVSNEEPVTNTTEESMYYILFCSTYTVY